MGLKLKDIVNYMENIDTGLLIGDINSDVKKVMLCLDVTTTVVEEAIGECVDLIISHHPIIFGEIKNIRTDNYKGRIITNLLKNNISVICAHTNLDIAPNGLNSFLLKRMGLKNVGVLMADFEEKFYKIVVFVPIDDVERVRNAMCQYGAGSIGKYSDCTFAAPGIGTYRPSDLAKPYIGEVGRLENVNEVRLESIVPYRKLYIVIEEMIKVHPYEEVAYDVYELALKGFEYGFGKYGYLDKPCDINDLIKLIKEVFKINSVRVIGSVKKEINTIAIFNGSLDEKILDAVERRNIDLLISGDIKYHTAVDIVERDLLVMDIGHFGSEALVVDLFEELFKNEFPTMDISICKSMNDPFVLY
jgi:dinuclear metal center YbgI/SA1388 family protein